MLSESARPQAPARPSEEPIDRVAEHASQSSGANEGCSMQLGNRRLGEERKELHSSNLPPDDDNAALVDAVNLKHRLRDI